MIEKGKYYLYDPRTPAGMACDLISELHDRKNISVSDLELLRRYLWPAADMEAKALWEEEDRARKET